ALPAAAGDGRDGRAPGRSAPAPVLITFRRPAHPAAKHTIHAKGAGQAARPLSDPIETSEVSGVIDDVDRLGVVGSRLDAAGELDRHVGAAGAGGERRLPDGAARGLGVAAEHVVVEQIHELAVGQATRMGALELGRV
ncbi:hypothetical protein QU39_00130, partial [Staphylococcus aureus]